MIRSELSFLYSATLAVTLMPALACSDKDTGGDGSASGTGDTTGTGTTGTTGPMICPGLDEPGEALEGEPCVDNIDCASVLCLQFQDTPPDDDAVCGAELLGCETRVTGTVRNFTNPSEVVGGVELGVYKALEVIGNPNAATPIATGTTAADGTIDITTASQISASIAIVALVEGGGFYRTSTGLATPVEEEDGPSSSYAPGVGIHDYWAVPEDMLTTWTAGLMDDAEAQPYLPLGSGPEDGGGGVVGFAQNSSTGEAAEGVVIVPSDEASTAVIRYLAEDGQTFTTEMTGSSGLFVILGPGTAEEFVASKDGTMVSDFPGTVGEARDVIFTLIMQVTP